MVIYISFARHTSLYEQSEYLGVAQFGSVLEWGSRGRKFESSHPDVEKALKQQCFEAFPLSVRKVLILSNEYMQ